MQLNGPPVSFTRIGHAALTTGRAAKPPSGSYGEVYCLEPASDELDDKRHTHEVRQAAGPHHCVQRLIEIPVRRPLHPVSVDRGP